MNIRLYNSKDYEMLSTWWIDSKEPGPLKEMLPEDSTFILEDRGTPVMSVSLYLPNCKFMAYVENFVKHPDYDNDNAAFILSKHIEDFAKDRGYSILVCLSYKDKLKQRYQELGYVKTLDGLSSFVKDLRR